MKDLETRQKVLIMMGVEGVLAFLLIFTPIFNIDMVVSVYRFGYLQMIGALLHIVKIPELSLEGEELFVLLFYTLIVTSVIAMCILMTVKAYRSKGRIIYLVGNLMALGLTLFVVAIANAGTAFMMLVSAGFGYKIGLFLSIVGIVLAIMNMKNRWTSGGKKSGRGSSRLEKGKEYTIREKGKHAADRIYASAEKYTAERRSYAARPDAEVRSHVARPGAETRSYAPERIYERAPENITERMPERIYEKAVEGSGWAGKVKYNMRNQQESEGEEETFYKGDDL